MLAVFKKPYYMPFESGLNAIAGVPFLPIQKWSDFKKLNKQLTNSKTLDKAKELYQTLIFDGVESASLMCQDYICSKFEAESIGSGNGGYGLWKEYEAEFKRELNLLTSVGYTIIFISHEGTREFADENGEAVITLPSPAIDGQEYQISVIAHNKLRYQQSINVTVNSPVIICTESVVNDNEFNGNGIADFGETISLNLTFKNTGDVSCNNAVFSVVSNCDHINFTQNTTETGVLEPGQEITIENAFSAEISPYIAPKDVIIAISSGQAKEWFSSFILPVGGAVPVISDFLVEEISNDPNGRVDPGESATLYYTLENNGNAPIENLRISIEARDIFVTCQEPELTIEELGAGETFTFSFDIETDEETPDGFTSFIGFEMTADRGLLFEQDNFTFIGLPGILICDLDKNHNSAQKIMSDLKAAGASAEYSDFIPENINDFDAIFLCLGIFPDYHDVSEEEGQIFADYLNQGGKLYMESGSFWYFNDHTPLHDMMQIESAIGNGWIYGNEELVGIESTFGEGMEFGYTGDNLRIDHLEVTEPTYLVFNSEPHTFGAMAALETDT